jgi:serine protease Do
MKKEQIKMQKKILVSLLFSGILVSGCFKDANQQPTQVIKEVVVEGKNQLQLPNFVSLVKRCGSSVVNIVAEVSQKDPVNTFGGLDPNDPLFELFKQFIPPQPQKPQTRHSFGSGFIISQDGYILTNAHVVNGGKKIKVKTNDKQELDAKLIGVDTKTDIALIKVDGKNLNAVKVGDPSKLEVGEWVAAIGAPFGFDNSVTQGIVSAKGRSLPTDSYVPFIQTDVPINPGNSGGPLFNLNGEVVGINSQIYSRSGGYMGISFSIPIDIAMSISNQLKQYGKVSHGQLGVMVQPVTKQLASSFGLKKAVGALVANVVAASGAETAGVKVGDVILKADGKDIVDSANLPLIIGSRKPGEKVQLVIFRNGSEITLDVTLGGMENKADVASASSSDQESKPKALQLDKFGLHVADLDAATKEQLKVKAGALVTTSLGVAQLAGVVPGDVILSVNNKPVTSAAQVKTIIGAGKTVALLISRGGQQMFITMSID